MPKLAATLASLLLIASSIGVNIARYPQVGRTIEPAKADAAQTANSSPLASQQPVAETETAEQPLAKPETAAAIEAAPQATGDREEFANRSFVSNQLAPAGAPIQTAVPIIDVRPMAPPPASLDAKGGSSPWGAAAPLTASGVQRLPPVETSGFADAEAVNDSVDPRTAYPTTLTP